MVEYFSLNGTGHEYAVIVQPLLMLVYCRSDKPVLQLTQILQYGSTTLAPAQYRGIRSYPFGWFTVTGLHY
jgi:hypothetical protein